MRSSLKYINWKKDCEVQHVKQQEFWDLYHQLKNDNYTKVEPSTIVFNYPPKSFSIKTVGKYKSLAICDYDYRKRYYETNYKDDKKNELLGNGAKSYNIVSTLFEKRTGVSITKAFSGVPEEYKLCVPKQLYYINDLRLNTIINHVSAIDFCSHYPSCTCGRLPDAHPSKIKKYNGTIKPTEDMPFAFYLKSGHLAEYGVFDTHEWKNSFMMRSLLGEKENYNGDPFLNPDDDITVLMPSSPYTLDEEMKYLYDNRKQDEMYKIVMNAFIGMCHTEKYRSHKKAHIAAIVIARANDKMRVLCDSIGIEKVLHVCVDGCIYEGKERYGTDIKMLQNCYQEFNDCSFLMAGMNCYAAIGDNGVIKFKHGAFDARKDGKSIEEFEKFSDMKQWYKKLHMEEIV